ncbi:MAG TPA: DinB family protein, partial [Gemmatimonadaceae bacterium]
MTAVLRRLFDHLVWADRRVLEGLQTAPGTDPQALAYFAHVLAAEHVWLARLDERVPEYAVWPTLSYEECVELAERNHREFAEAVERLEAGDADREVAYRNSAGQSFVSRADDILLHVALHGAYHRGQVSLMVRRSGGEPAPTDYIA